VDIIDFCAAGACRRGNGGFDPTMLWNGVCDYACVGRYCGTPCSVDEGACDGNGHCVAPPYSCVDIDGSPGAALPDAVASDEDGSAARD
jgi:hypothetical protein